VSSPLVLLHAFPLSSTMWERLAPHLADHTVVAVDLPGLGGSPVPADEPTMRAMATLVLEALDGQGIASATFVGLSTGGYVALQVAADAPERVDGLVLASTTCWPIEPDLPDDRRATADELERSGSLEPVLGSAHDGLGETARREQPDLEPLLREVILAGDPASVAWTARAVASRDDTSAVLAGLDRPVLLLFGEEDTETPPARGEAMRDLRPASSDTRLVVLPGTGHLTALEQPMLVAGHLRTWLSETGLDALPGIHQQG